MTTIIRTATILHPDEARQPSIETVRRYLPSNYQAVQQGDNSILIVGTDQHGWTLHSYVIPRLASGLITATEGWYLEVPELTVVIADGRVQIVNALVEGVKIAVAAKTEDWDRPLVDVIGDEIKDVPNTYTV